MVLPGWHARRISSGRHGLARHGSGPGAVAPQTSADALHVGARARARSTTPVCISYRKDPCAAFCTRSTAPACISKLQPVPCCEAFCTRATVAPVAVGLTWCQPLPSPARGSAKPGAWHLTAALGGVFGQRLPRPDYPVASERDRGGREREGALGTETDDARSHSVAHVRATGPRAHTRTPAPTQTQTHTRFMRGARPKSSIAATAAVPELLPCSRCAPSRPARAPECRHGGTPSFQLRERGEGRRRRSGFGRLGRARQRVESKITPSWHDAVV